MFDDFLKVAWRMSGVFRGAAAALSIASILHGLSLWEFPSILRFTHALVTHWNHVLLSLLQPIYLLLPHLPKLSAQGANLLALLVAFLPFMMPESVRLFQRKRYFDALVYASVAPLLLPLPWLLEGVTYLSGDDFSAGFIGIFLVGVVALSLVAVFDKKLNFESVYAKGIVSGLIALAVFEVLYLVPQVAEAAEGFVQSAERLDASTAE